MTDTPCPGCGAEGACTCGSDAAADALETLRRNLPKE